MNYPSLECVHQMMTNIEASHKEMRKTQKAIANKGGKASAESLQHAMHFLSHAATIRSAADELLRKGLETKGQAIIDGCCMASSDAAKSDKKKAKKKSTTKS